MAVPHDVMVSDLSRSKSGFENGLVLAKRAENKLAQAEILANLSTVTYLQGELDGALDNAIQAIALFEELNQPIRVGSMYCGIGYSLKRRDMAKANEYMRTGISILEQHTDTAALEAGYNNYGVLKEMENQLDSADHYYSLAVNSATARNDSVALPYALNHVASAALLNNNFPKAKRYFDQSYTIRKNRNEAYGILENTIYYGDYFVAVGKPDSAVVYFNSAISQSYAVGYPYMRQYCFEQLALVYELEGSAEKALAAQKMYSAIKDSLITEKRTEALAKMETRFRTTEKEKENLILKQQKQEQELVVSRQRNWIIGLTGAALIILLFGLFMFQRNKRIAEAKRDAAIIEEREKGLRSIIQATEDERKRIAKDLHDGIVQSLTGLSLRMQKQAGSEKAKDSGLHEELDSTRGILDESIAEVRGISHQMMPRVFGRNGPHSCLGGYA